MGIFDRIKSAFKSSLTTGEASDFDRAISATREEHLKKSTYFYDLKISQLEVYQNEIKEWPDKKKVEFLLYCIADIHKYNSRKSPSSYSSTYFNTNIYRHHRINEAYVTHLLRTKLSLEDDDVLKLLEAFPRNKVWNLRTLTDWPVALLLNQVIKQYKDRDVPESVNDCLLAVKRNLEKIKSAYDDKERLKLIDKIDNILFNSNDGERTVKPSYFLGDDRFTKFANPTIKAIKDPKSQEIWFQLISLSQTASGSKPSKKYLNETKALIKELGAEKFKKVVNDWLSFSVDLDEEVKEVTSTYGNQTYTYNSYEYLSSVNQDALKGFIWMCSHFHDAATIQNLSDLAARSYKKIPGVGPVAAALGNACFYALFKSRGLDGIGQLSRLKLKIKQNNALKIISRYLEQAAKEKGISIHDIEDLSVESHGLTDGKREFQFDEYKAIIEIQKPGRSELSWIKPDGKPQKSVPAFVKEKHATKLKKLKNTKKQVDQTTSAQKERIDRMFRSDRKLSMEDFEKLYLQHGLMTTLTQKLIWSFHLKNKKTSGIYLNRKWTDANGQEFTPDPQSAVALWHPAKHTVKEIQQWRGFLVENEIQQPLKQAYREVYLLTEAEINTKVYSNRMAAHILKQHQYVTLAKSRSWKATLMGAWDGGDQDIAELDLPEYSLKAQFWVQSLNANESYNDMGIWNYVSTDQVRFVNRESNDTIDLVEVPPVLLSEVLRDVDLFVGVASVGNDPEWSDSGGIPQFRNYWESYSFGELTEIAKNRKEILEGLMPRLKIRDVAKIQDKFLVVKGKLRTYKIHIGSTNILMEPDDQYLCIVPDQGKRDHTDNLFVPFEGDNGLSIILSKAFLLADDYKIKDTTITSQINRK